VLDILATIAAYGMLILCILALCAGCIFMVVITVGMVQDFVDQHIKKGG
jgi:F0F1-type ATP synthase assembly protein I